MAAPGAAILEPLRRTLSQQQQQTGRLTKPNSPTEIHHQQQQLQNTFDDFDDRVHEIRAHDESNRWQWIHYYHQNNTRLKLTPTFNEMAPIENATENLDLKTIESLNSRLDSHRQQSLADMAVRAAAAQTANNHHHNNKTQSIIESIKSKLMIYNNHRPSTHAARANSTTPAHSVDHLAQLSCDSGEMVIRLNFTEPFRGVVYPDHNRLSACRFFGDGHHNYELRLPLRGCGTRQVSSIIGRSLMAVRLAFQPDRASGSTKTSGERASGRLESADLWP
jgi:hypothetical protein